MLTATVLPLFRLICFYIGGIILAIYYPTDLFTTLLLLLTLGVLYWMAALHVRVTTFKWLNFIGLLLIFLVGYSNLLLQTAQQRKAMRWMEVHQEIEGYTVCIKKVYAPFRCKAFITHIKDHSGWHNSRGSIQLYFSKSSDYIPKQRDKLLIHGRPDRILLLDRIQLEKDDSAFYHPFRHRHILKQIDRDFKVLTTEVFNQDGNWRAMIIEWCSKRLHEQLQDDQAIALISALLWGAKETLDPGLQKAYADTGTIHVLAISGLHVGMLYMLLKIIFKYICRYVSFFILPDLCTLLLLWLYSWLCHFAPPILRATIMITIARIGLLSGRGSNRYNGLFASAFVLLLWDPSLLFNCAFQLSYLATIGILYLQPLLHRLIILEHYCLRQIWTATTLSITAQVSTLPLILYYFKQFPLYFIIANWLVVPAIFAILMVGLAFLVSSHCPILNTLLGFTLEKLIFTTNALVYWLAKWPMGTLTFCYTNRRTVCLLYIVLLSIWLFFQYKNLIYLIITSLCATLYSVYHIKTIIAAQKKCKITCYNNHQLSFTLKDGIRSLRHDEPPSNNSILQHYTAGIIATWYKKVILTLHTIPSDWHGWRGAKLDVDYLLIDENLLHNMAIILKVWRVKNLVIYTKQANPLRYYPKIKKLDIPFIFLKPGSKKALTWSKNL
ncbi:ComEC/Rec2 family competence protein [Cardinium endosymbiont of Bemisia tabaci]|uniref:ComEC/Rec2 family competence protein n=1 Tax=Cardinium endosymbiont of Bemisia tabaci TaxID=672794 RepID=UPI000442D261|nr:ComEC/Rec2 family competence protein [Cardinium endosymbiont of Bemisia tabaci]CDG49563.1 ComEC/Rec2-related protein [Cardinium endosymbiont cBtQ1 of Bemisia tabaci]